MRRVLGFLVFLFVILPLASTAEVPNQAHFNGYLNNAAGDPIDCPDAVQCVIPVNIGFALYDSEDSEIALWEEVHTAVPIYQGSFHVELGSLNDLDPGAAGDARYLSVSINGGAEMLPRLSLNSSVFAMRAAQADIAIDADNAAQLGGMAPTHYATSESVTNLESELAPIASTGSYNDLLDVPSDLADGDDNTQLDESAVDTFVANNGYALQTDLTDLSSGLATIATSGSFNDLSDVPAGLADGDDNTQLSESEVDTFVANNGYALQTDLTALSSGLATIATSGSFNDLSDVPADLADGDDNTQLSEIEVDTFVANNGYALDADISTVGKTGLYTDLLSTPWVENAGHLEHKGTLSIFGPGDSLNVTMGSKNATDETEKGQLLIHDAEGDRTAMMNVGTDGAGMLTLYGPNGELNLGLWNRLGSPDRPLLALYGETGAQRIFLDITEDDAGRSFYYGPNESQNVAIWYQSTDANDGLISIFDDTDTAKATLGVTSSNAGNFQLYGPNGGHNISMWHYGSTPDYGLFEIYDDADEVNLALGITDGKGGFGRLYGANGKSNVFLGHYTDHPNHGAMNLYDETETIRLSLNVSDTSNAGQIRTYGPNGTPTAWLSSYSTRPDFGAMVLYNDAEINFLRLDSMDSGAGALRAYGPNGNLNVGLWSYAASPDHGAINLYDADEVIRARLDVFGDSNAGQLRLYGPNGNQNVYLSSYGARPDQGVLLLYDEAEATMARMDIGSNGSGALRLYGPNGNENIFLSAYSTSPNDGFFLLQDDTATARVRLDISSKAGQVRTYGSNGESNNYIGYASWVGGDAGYIAAQDSAGASQAGAYVDENGNGVIFGDIKNFRMDHPEDPQKEIWYACIEGPEAAAYARGTATLVNGHARVELPEHFRLIAAEQGLTVAVTPLSADSKGMAVIEKTPSGFRVRELMSGRGTYSFDWEIKGIRRGYEDYQVVRPAIKLVGGPDPGPEQE